jgi:tRNA (guanine37-N1)-methyltransferase
VSGDPRLSPASPWTARVLTLFPELFPGPLGASLSGQALVRGLWRLETLDIRDFASDKHATVDDAPFGGGPGMVMRPDVVDAAIAAGLSSSPVLPLVHLTPRGRPLDQAWVKEHAAGPGLVLLCGRYEGVDQRVLEARRPIEVSLGDFVLAGGDVAAMVVIEACVRLLPGVIGEPAALNEESFEQGLLEYPQYTRPREWQGRGVPEVLLSGDHGRIARWRREQAEQLTRERRPDLWARYQGEGGSGGAGSLRDSGPCPYVTASGKDDGR